MKYYLSKPKTIKRGIIFEWEDPPREFTSFTSLIKNLPGNLHIEEHLTHAVLSMSIQSDCREYQVIGRIQSEVQRNVPRL